MKTLLTLFLFSFNLYSVPPLGQVCAPGYWYDGQNCSKGAVPSGTQAFVWNQGFYHSGNSQADCDLSSSYFDSANCFLGPVPLTYDSFIWQNTPYTKINPMFKKTTNQCPGGFSFDMANCYLGTAPAGREARIRFGHFGFNRSFYQNCSNLYPGAYGLADPWTCGVKPVPSGYHGFIHNNSWYTEPGTNGDPVWSVKNDVVFGEGHHSPVCLQDPDSQQWQLDWSDEFDDQSPSTVCYNSGNEKLWTARQAWWGSSADPEAPTNWSDPNKLSARYQGLYHLNKCRWVVNDSFNYWEYSLPVEKRAAAFDPANIQIDNGILTMYTQAHGLGPGEQYDCGQPTLAHNPYYPGGEVFGKKCPYSGAMIQSMSNLPWTAHHSINNSDAGSRYVGAHFGYGAFEIKARLTSVGHGAWPALWLFTDQNPNHGQQGPNSNNIEMDLLEAIGPLPTQSPGEMSKLTYFRAIQTNHNWPPGSSSTASGVAIPLNIGEWYTYRIEWDPDKLKVYINDCLRNVIHNGQTVYDEWTGEASTFYIPRNQTAHFIINNVPSNAGYMPSWYTAHRLQGGGPRSDFIPTVMEVDYVRYFKKKLAQGKDQVVSPDVPQEPSTPRPITQSIGQK